MPIQLPTLNKYDFIMHSEIYRNEVFMKSCDIYVRYLCKQFDISPAITDFIIVLINGAIDTEIPLIDANQFQEAVIQFAKATENQWNTNQYNNSTKRCLRMYQILNHLKISWKSS